jgi:hypothetical protein
MKSLLIVGFPKGFTTAAWQIAHRATGLQRPQVSANEVLNPARIRQSGRGWIRGFLREHDPMSDGFFSRNPKFYPKARAVLDHFAEGGFCIKDVVQPDGPDGKTYHIQRQDDGGLTCQWVKSQSDAI